MKEREQIEAFAADIKRVVDRYRSEFTLTLATAVGVLEVVKLELFTEETQE